MDLGVGYPSCSINMDLNYLSIVIVYQMASTACLCDADGADVLAVAGGSVSGAEQAGKEAAQPLRTDTAADGVRRRGRGTCIK